MPYVIDASFTPTERAVIAQGITHVEENSCVKFVPRNGDFDYLEIIPGSGGCYAQIPYWPGRGRMEVNLIQRFALICCTFQIGLNPSGCVYMSVVVHELLHTLGVKHEQSRPDRDDYIRINWQNMMVSI